VCLAIHGGRSRDRDAGGDKIERNPKRVRRRAWLREEDTTGPKLPPRQGYLEIIPPQLSTSQRQVSTDRCHCRVTCSGWATLVWCTAGIQERLDPGTATRPTPSRCGSDTFLCRPRRNGHTSYEFLDDDGQTALCLGRTPDTHDAQKSRPGRLSQSPEARRFRRNGSEAITNRASPGTRGLARPHGSFPRKLRRPTAWPALNLLLHPVYSACPRASREGATPGMSGSQPSL
jgi:hypothetical protein